MNYASFEPHYQGNPRWEVGEPQPAVVALAEKGRFAGRRQPSPEGQTHPATEGHAGRRSGAQIAPSSP